METPQETATGTALRVETDAGITTLRLDRPPVNALVTDFIASFRAAVRTAVDGGSDALVLTGTGSFFSFGFDVPSALRLDRDEFRTFLTAFTSLYRELFIAPIPVVAALNGHTVAGGAMIAIAADIRVMTTARSKMSLNEIAIGVPVFAGFVEMLTFLVGGGAASRILYSGAMYPPPEAHAIGMVEHLAAPDDVLPTAQDLARTMSRNAAPFSAIKKLLRGETAARMAAAEPASIEVFMDVWFSRETQPQLKRIEIRGR